MEFALTTSEAQRFRCQRKSPKQMNLISIVVRGDSYCCPKGLSHFLLHHQQPPRSHRQSGKACCRGPWSIAKLHFLLAPSNGPTVTSSPISPSKFAPAPLPSVDPGQDGGKGPSGFLEKGNSCKTRNFWSEFAPALALPVFPDSKHIRRDWFLLFSP